MNINFKYFSGHESFYLREGWIRKGLLAVKKNPSLFVQKNLTSAIDELGVGSNMVKSIRYWLEFFRLIDKDTKENTYSLTTVAKKLLEKDPYFQNTNTLWILHVLSVQQTVNNEGDVSLANSCVWQIIFADAELSTFNKEKLVANVSTRIKEQDVSYAAATVKSGLATFFNTYHSEKKDANPEENIISPLTKLKLITTYEKNLFRFRTISSTEFSPYVIYFILFNQSAETSMIQLEEAFEEVRKCIKIDIKTLRHAIDRLVLDEVVTIDRAAGLNNIRVVEKLSLSSIIDKITKRNS